MHIISWSFHNFFPWVGVYCSVGLLFFLMGFIPCLISMAYYYKYVEESYLEQVYNWAMENASVVLMWFPTILVYLGFFVINSIERSKKDSALK